MEMHEEEFEIKNVGDLINVLQQMRHLKIDTMYMIGYVDDDLVTLRLGSTRDIAQAFIIAAIDDDALRAIINTAATKLPSRN